MFNSELLSVMPLSSEDEAFFKQIYTDADMMRLVGDAMSDEKASTLFLRSLLEYEKLEPNYHFFLIKNQQTQVPIGITGWFWNQASRKSIEMGVMIDKAFKNQGFAYKVFTLLMSHVFNENDCESIVVFCHKDNHPANRIAVALGYNELKLLTDEKTQKNVIKWGISIEQFKQRKKRQPG